MQDRVIARDAASIAVSPGNPCPFLRALVAGGYVGGHTVPLPEICKRIEAASGEQGVKQTLVGKKTYGVALGANPDSEIAGRVVATGAAATEWLGRRVLAPRLLTCGECARCRRGPSRAEATPGRS